MRAMILAAGLGTRLRPLTNKIPKALIPVNNRPLIAYSLALLQAHGVSECMINVHHLGEHIEAALGVGEKFGIKIHYSYEPELLGTGGGLKKVADFFEDESFWVVNSDIIIDADLTAISTQHRRTQALATMILRPHPVLNDETSRPTALFINDKARIVSIASGQAIEMRRHEQPYMFTGVHLINPKLLDRLPEGFSCIFQDAYKPAIAAGKNISAAVYHGYWRDLGTMEQYQLAEQELNSGQVRLSYPVPYAA